MEVGFRKSVALARCEFCEDLCNGFVWERFVGFSRHPKAVHDHGKFSRNRNYRPFLATVATSLVERGSPAPQGGIHAEGAEELVSTLYEKLSQITVFPFANS